VDPTSRSGRETSDRHNIREEFRGNNGRDSRSNRRSKGNDVRFSRLFMNLGKNDQVDKRSIINLINKQMPGKSVEIGQIEILRNFSFFEVDNRYERDIQKAFCKVQFNGKRIELEAARPKGE